MKYRQVCVRLGESELLRIQEVARLLGVTMSAALRLMIRAHQAEDIGRLAVRDALERPVATGKEPA